MIRELVLITVASFFLTSCIRMLPEPTIDPAAPCDTILKPVLLSVPFEEFMLEGPETEAWISTTFPTATVEYSEVIQDGGTVEQFFWSEGDDYYTLILSQEKRYLQTYRLASQGPTLKPSLGHILRCFGDPAYYSWEVGVPMGETMGTFFRIWYPKLGISFVDLTRGPGSYRYTASSPMDVEIWILPVGSIEEMVQNEFGIEEYVRQQLALLREWPDNFTEITVEE